MDTAYSPRLHEEELSDAANAIQESRLAAERKSERMDAAYSPRLHEEELSATANKRSAIINLLSPIRMGRLAKQGAFLRR